MTCTSIALQWAGSTFPEETPPMNQQTYLQAAYDAIRRDILPDAPTACLISYGFPKGRSTKKQKVLGECWTSPTPENTSAVIFVHPCQWTSPLDVLHVLAHEICHAMTPGEGHKGKFLALARSIGLEGKATATTPGKELTERLNAIAYQLGEFPKAAFDALEKTKPQTTRLRLYLCACDPGDAKEEGRTNKIRAATDNLEATCDVCASPFVLQAEKEKTE